ncbi:Neprilysin-1 [Halotydeus destructor]|nr:Neprilysin-1 [Halotydeus destructor]
MNERSHLITGDEPGFWERRSTLGKTLLILAGLAVLGAIAAAIVLTIANPGKDDHGGSNGTTTTTTTTTTTMKPTDAPTGTPITTTSTLPPSTTPGIITICQTAMCQNEANRIRDNMDNSTHPCDDFEQFVCGGYKKNHEIPEDKGRYGTFDALEENVWLRLRELYDRDYVHKEIEPLTFARYLFQSCNDTNVLENRGYDPLVRLLDRIGGWPMAGSNTTYNNNTYSWRTAFAEITSNHHNNILLSISVQPDYKNTSKYVIFLDQPEFGVGRKDLLSYHNDSESTKIVDAYRQYIKSTVNLFNNNSTIGLDEQITHLVDFEIDLAAAAAAPEDRRDMTKMYHKMTFSELGSRILDFDWWGFIEDLYMRMGSPIKIQPDDEVVILDLPYLEHLSRVLYQHQGNRSALIANYLGWRMLQQDGWMTTDEFRQNEYKFDAAKTGVEKPVDLWKRCLNFITDETPSLKVQQIVEFLRSAFEEILRDKDWFDQETKEKALVKLNKIVSNIGYPSWVKDDAEVSRYFNFSVEVDKLNPFDSAEYLREFILHQRFNKYKKEVDLSHEWPMGPSIVNAAYEPTQNSITVPAGILQLVFFNESRPDYLNYGAIGAVIGHELTHGFDDQGAQYDETGNLNNWWSNHTQMEFNNRAKCFVDQYSSIVDDRLNLTLNGKNTLGENIADNGGLREAYYAYHSRVGTLLNMDGLLPGFEKYTVDQMFFISYANNWCSLIRDEKLRQSILYDPHSPTKYRVNVPLSNFDKFSTAFTCQKGSNMFPAERCVLW